MRKVEKGVYLTALMIFAFVLSIGFTYAYIQAKLNIIENESIVMTARSDITINYTEGTENFSGADIIPGWSDTKSFTLTNPNSFKIYYNIRFANVTNQFTRQQDLKYTLTGDGGTVTAQIPASGATPAVFEAIALNPATMHTYTLTVEYLSVSDQNQIADLGKQFNFTLVID